MTDTDYEIAEALVDYVGEDGICTEIEVGNNLVEVKGYIRTYGYTEDDYFDGTGYRVTTSADINLSFDVRSFDDDGNEIESQVDIDEDGITDWLYKEIID
jgi:hypothetical protein